MSSRFEEWEPPEQPVVQTLSDIDPRVLAEMRAHFEAVDPIRVSAGNMLGIQNYLERLDQASGVFDVGVLGADTSIYSYEVPAGQLWTRGAVGVRIGGRFLNNTGAGRTFTLTIKFGATTVWKDTSASVTSSANWRPFVLDFVLGNLGVTNSQEMNGFILSADFTAPTTGIGPLSVAGGAYPIASTEGAVTEDTTQKKKIEVLYQLSAAHALLQFKRDLAYTTKIA